MPTAEATNAIARNGFDGLLAHADSLAPFMRFGGW
jgi:hypothetical protein